MKLPIQLLRRFALKPRRRLNIERGRDKRLNTELSALRYAQPSSIGMANTLDAVRAITPSLVSAPRRSLHKRLYPKLCCIAAVTFVGTVYAYWAYIERSPVVAEEWYEDAVRASRSNAPETSFLTSQDMMGAASRNAYDTYTALVKTVNLDQIERLPHFGKAGGWEQNIRYSSDTDKIINDDKQIFALADAILKRNAREMQPMRAALNSSYIDTDRWTPSEGHKNLGNFKKLWSLLMLEASISAKRKNSVQAAYAALDAIQFATQIQSNTPIVPKITGMHWEVPARALLWDALPHLKPIELQRVISRMDAIIILSQQTTIDQALMSARIEGRQEMLRVFNEPNWRWQVVSDYAPEDTPQLTKLVEFLKSCRYSKRQILANFDGIMLEEIQWSRGNFYETRGEMKIARADDPFSHNMVPGYGNGLYFDMVTRNQNQLLMTYASILLYKQDKGIYPNSLADLSRQGKYLANNKHTDLFAVRDKTTPPLRYLLKNGGFVLYSIGPDMKDDGGRAICNPDKSASYNAVLQDSRGDIVAGVNRNFR